MRLREYPKWKSGHQHFILNIDETVGSFGPMAKAAGLSLVSSIVTINLLSSSKFKVLSRKSNSCGGSIGLINKGAEPDVIPDYREKHADLSRSGKNEPVKNNKRPVCIVRGIALSIILPLKAFQLVSSYHQCNLVTRKRGTCNYLKADLEHSSPQASPHFVGHIQMYQTRHELLEDVQLESPPSEEPLLRASSKSDFLTRIDRRRLRSFRLRVDTDGKFSSKALFANRSIGENGLRQREQIPPLNILVSFEVKANNNFRHCVWMIYMFPPRYDDDDDDDDDADAIIIINYY
ncbi:hypothetical protein GQX74_006770 [Glossina fuscipes]|nr:hypothetical protein GQX74_006770 [Glossina fuscipes]